METTFCELKGKEVINIIDGKRLGRIIDLVFESNYGKILGFVVPCYNKSWNIFKSSDDIFIPYKNVCKIGDDVILVEIFVANKQQNFKKGKNSTQYLKSATLSTPSNNANGDENYRHMSNADINIENPIQLNTNNHNASQFELNKQNSLPLYPQNSSSYNTKDINK